MMTSRFRRSFLSPRGRSFKRKALNKQRESISESTANASSSSSSSTVVLPREIDEDPKKDEENPKVVADTDGSGGAAPSVLSSHPALVVVPDASTTTNSTNGHRSNVNICNEDVSSKVTTKKDRNEADAVRAMPKRVSFEDDQNNSRRGNKKNSFGNNRFNSISNMRNKEETKSVAGAARRGWGEKENEDMVSQVRKLKAKLREKEEESLFKTNELALMNDKFHDIQQGLEQVEEERQFLIKSRAKSIDEKQRIQRELDIRLKEVSSLVRRCTLQETKMREAAQAKAAHNDLLVEIEQLKTSIAKNEGSNSRIKALESELKGCQEAKAELEERLDKLKKDHDEIAETLNGCFQKMQKMSDAERENEGDHRRDLQRAELKLEQQRLAHTDELNALQCELDCRQGRIDQIEQVLKDKTAVTNALRREKVDLLHTQDQQLAKQRLEHEREVETLHDQHESDLSDLKHEHQIAISELRTVIDNKDLAICKLEEEVSEYMDRLMKLSSELHGLHESASKQAVNHQKELDRLQSERNEVQKELENKESQTRVLQMNVSKLQDENEELVVEVDRWKSRAQELERENTFIMELEHQLQEVNIAVEETEGERDRVEREHLEAMNRLKSEHEDERKMWSTMETELHARITELEQEKELLAVEVQTTIDDKTVLEQHELVQVTMERDTVRQDLRELQEAFSRRKTELESAERYADAKHQELLQTRQELDRLSEQHAQVKTQSVEMESTISALQLELDIKSESIDMHKSLADKLSTELDQARSDLEGQQQKSTRYEEQLQQARDVAERILQEHGQTSQHLQSELMDSRNTVNEVERQLNDCQDQLTARDEAITKLQSELNKERSATQTLQQERGEISKELEKQRKLVQTTQSDLEDLVTSNASTTKLLQEELASHVQEMESMKEELAVRDVKLSEMETSLSQERDGLEQKSALVESLRRELSIRDARVEELESLLSSERMLVKGLQNDMDQMQESQQSSETERARDLETANKILANRDMKIVDLETLLSKKCEAMQENTTLVGSLRDQVSNRDAQVEELTAFLSRERETTGELRFCLEKAQSAHATAIQTLTGEVASRDVKILELDAQLLNERNASISLKDKLETALTATANLECNVRELQQEISETSTALKKTSKRLDESEESIQQQHNKLLQEQESSAALRLELNQIQSELVSSQRTTQQERHELEEVIENHESLVASLKLQLMESKARADQMEALMTQASQSFDKDLARLKVSNDEYRTRLRQEEMSHRMAISDKDLSIQTMEEQVKTLEQSLSSNQKLLSERDSNMESLRKQIKDQTASFENEVQTLQHNFEIKNGKIRSLEMELKQVREETEEEAESLRRDVLSLTTQLQRTQTDLQLAQDDIRDLRLCDLKEAEETIEELSLENKSMRTKLDSVAKNNTEVTTQYEIIINELQDKILSLEKLQGETDKLHAHNLERKGAELEALQSEIANLSEELALKYTKLQERHVAISRLTESKAELETRELELKATLERLKSDLTKTKGDYERKIQAMACALRNQETNREDDESAFLERQAEYARKLAETEGLVEAEKEKVLDLERQLDGRTKLLTDMVAHNKATEESQERLQAEVDEIKCDIEIAKSEKEKMEAELERQQAEWRRKEDQFLEMIQNERHLKEIAEEDLAQLIAKESSSRRDIKELEELEKENAALKDKVRRQEAYLKRKLEQDKLMRDRSSKLTGKSNARSSGGGGPMTDLTTPLRDRTISRSNTPQNPNLFTLPQKNGRISSPSFDNNNSSFGFGGTSTRKGGGVSVTTAQQRKNRSRLQAPTAVTASTSSVVSDVSSLLMDDWDGQSQYSGY